MQGYPSSPGQVSCASLGLTALNEHQLLSVLLHLSPADALRVSTTSKQEVFHRSALMDSLWERHVRRIFAFDGDEPTGCEETTLPTWRAAYESWHQALRNVGAADVAAAALRLGRPAPMARWIRTWSRLHGWLKETPAAKAIRETLRGGAKAEDISQLEKICSSVSPMVLDCWRLVDGQAAPLLQQGATWAGGTMPVLSDRDDWSRGLFGGYQTYHHTVSDIFLPLSAAIKITLKLREELSRVPSFENSGQLDNKLIFATSFNLIKFLYVDLSTGEVFIFTRKPWAPFEAAVPADAKKCDGFARWFEEYVRRLESKWYVMDFISPQESPMSLGISLFPATPPEMTVCVTKGVEVRASPIYMPEHDAGWTYSIALRLVGTAAERGFERCQLLSRRWEIEEEGRPEPEQVEGEGVIGLFPILVDGGWIVSRESDPHGQYQTQGRSEGFFRYQSCSGRSTSMKGRFGGSLEFVPGTKKNREGQPFRVRVEPFRLYIPDFIF